MSFSRVVIRWILERSSCSRREFWAFAVELEDGNRRNRLRSLHLQRASWNTVPSHQYWTITIRPSLQSHSGSKSGR